MSARPSATPTPSSTQSSSSALGSPAILTDYEPLEIIGNGSFGIIRKVRRKTDGVLLARKELNFERMTERDRKQIVAEVNILKELQHDNIVRYHDRFVDREHGILYILMEYCGGGDLSGIIKQSRKLKQPVPEDTIWAYLTQLLYALHYCHHPGAPLPGAGGAQGPEAGQIDCREGKQVILHRDLKPENVFLDANGSIKLGDFGLSKAISSSTFANTYVGTPYYMSPELINDSPYDIKSDIWALGCLLYELCAWNPPFHAAQTHQELAVHIRSGRIPPLPKQYSSTLVGVIKSMLSQAPHARPSAQMLMTHEKIVHSHKVLEAQKMYQVVRSRKLAVAQKEQQLTQREAAVAAKEAEMTAELANLHEQNARLVSEREQLQALQSQFHVEVRAYQETATRFQEEVKVWRDVQQREQDALEKDRRDFQDVIVKAQTGFEDAVSQAVELRAQEMVIAIGREEVLRQMGEVIRGEEREKVESALRIEYEARWQALQAAHPSQPPVVPESAVKTSRFSRRSLGKRALEELPGNIMAIPSAVARRFNAGDGETPSRHAQPHGNHIPGSGKNTPIGSNRAASKSLTDLSPTKKKTPSSGSASSALETPNGEACLPGTHVLEDQLAKIAYCTAGGMDSPSVSAAKKMARRMTTTSAIVRPPLPTHANTAPTAIPIWNPETLPPPPVYDMDDEENLPSPFLKKLSTKSRMSTGPLSQAKRGMLALAAANAAGEPKPPMTDKEQQAPTTTAGPPASAAANNAIKGPRLSMARAIKVGEEARQKLARRAL